MSTLPQNPNLRYLKGTAKKLLKACRSGEPEALSTLKKHPAFANVDDLTTQAAATSLQQVQHALAIEYGYPSWEKLLEDVRVQYTVFAPSYGGDVMADLCRGLAPGRYAVRVVETIEDALKSEGKVLVTSLLGQDTVDLTPDQITTLRKTKVFGIGYGAGVLFNQIGLELNDGMLMHYAQESYTEIQLESADSQTVVVQQTPPAPVQGHMDKVPHHCGIYLHPKSYLADHIQALARVTSDPAYAAIARQGHHILVGTHAEMAEWTPDYRKVLGGLLSELVNTSPAVAAKIPVPQSELGTCSFAVGERGSLTVNPGRTFNFRFSEPGTLTARLHQKGSTALALMINSRHDLLERVDAETGVDTLEASFEITPEILSENGDGSWTVSVSNFDPDHPAECEMDISYT